MKTSDPQESGEDMNVRLVHGAIWREFAEPKEMWRRAPWYLRHGFVIMLIVALVYLISQNYDWKEYEENPIRRVNRDLEILQKQRKADPPVPIRPKP